MSLTELKEEKHILLEKIRSLEKEHNRVMRTPEEKIAVSTAIVYLRKQLSVIQEEIIELISKEDLNDAGELRESLKIKVSGINLIQIRFKQS